ncbi:hypothetical protein [Clostridium tertium]|uniref:hypothetical protein n=1 Tax=Clostridium tertium TaxID=1559 RepID=UPI00374E4AA8
MELYINFKDGNNVKLQDEFDTENVVKCVQAMAYNQEKQAKVIVDTDKGRIERESSDVAGLYIKF